MRVLIGLAILVTIALLASSKRFYAFRRTRWGAALTTGGWMMVAVGFAIGPWGAGLVTPGHLLVVQPLILFCLGWVGLVIGFQAHHKLPSLLPASVARLSMWDLVLTLVLVGGAAAAVLVSIEGRWQDALPAAMLLAVCSLGWSAEVRSLGRTDRGGTRLTGIMRAAAGLSSLLAVVVYGLLVRWLIRESVEADGVELALAARRVTTTLGVSMVIGVAMGLLGWWLMSLVGRAAGEFLVVLMGVVAFGAGAAATTGYSALFVAALGGAVIVNLPGRALERFRRVIVDAEQPVAMVLMLVAGVMADPRIGLGGLALVAVLLAARAVVKQWLMRRLTASATQAAAASPALGGLMRQSPVAIALVAGYAVLGRGQAFGGVLDGPKLVMIVILLGIICEVWPFAQAGLSGGRRTAAEPPPAPPPEPSSSSPSPVAEGA